MPGLGRPEVGDFAFHPNVGIAALNSGTDGAHQIGHAPDAASGRLLKSEAKLVCE
jgi:hypothetical protein